MKSITDIDLEQLAKLAKLMCSESEAAHVLDCRPKELNAAIDVGEGPVWEAWQKGRAGAKESLRRLQWRHAQGEGGPAVTMAIHLAKHWLGENDKNISELTINGGKPIVVQIADNFGPSPEPTPQEIEHVRQIRPALEKRAPEILDLEVNK